MAADEWKKSEHVDHYLGLVDTVPHRAEGESVLLEQVPLGARRILDLGTGDGRLLALVRVDRPESVAAPSRTSTATGSGSSSPSWLGSSLAATGIARMT